MTTTTSTAGYREVLFLEGASAPYVLAMISSDGPEAAIGFLSGWDDAVADAAELRPTPYGGDAGDRVVEFGGYRLAWSAERGEVSFERIEVAA